jgi:deazaflavin-dependent oxidoreductase (nitroreductase family)
MSEHTRVYIETNGSVGHYIDVTAYGGRGPIPTLLLKTVGRRSGRPSIVPLIYGRYGGEVVLIASRGGEPVHPAWFLNMQAHPEVSFQIADKCFRGPSRVAEGSEREAVWKHMVGVYAPFADYQTKTDRRIPVVMMNPKDSISKL